ncbi:hypothetical protein V8C86DRAFT_2734537 [Haematococcus lacustris]
MSWLPATRCLFLALCRVVGNCKQTHVNTCCNESRQQHPCVLQHRLQTDHKCYWLDSRLHSWSIASMCHTMPLTSPPLHLTEHAHSCDGDSAGMWWCSC